MQLLNGKILSQSILSDLKLKIEDCSLKINLHVILVGNDPSSQKYVSLKQKKCFEIGINCTLHHLPGNTTNLQLISLIEELNNNPDVTGFFIQLPLPSHLDKNKILPLINPQKDVDGLAPNSPFMPAVDLGIINLLQHYGINFKNQNIVVVNDSNLIGQPLKKYFESQGARVSLCNQQTQNLAAQTIQADILISATGVKNLITAGHVKEGSVVVDVANGDVDFAEVSLKTSYITPTFGGIGPMTIACLLYNTYKAYVALGKRN